MFDNVKSIGITASASAPEILVQNFIKFVKKKYTVNLHESEFIKEEVNFKIPQYLNIGD